MLKVKVKYNLRKEQNSTNTLIESYLITKDKS
jgi:hypothetical protein